MFLYGKPIARYREPGRLGGADPAVWFPAWPTHMSKPALRLSDSTRARPRAQTSALSGLVSTGCVR
jgi:hypothetical protein